MFIKKPFKYIGFQPKKDLYAALLFGPIWSKLGLIGTDLPQMAQIGHGWSNLPPTGLISQILALIFNQIGPHLI